MTITGRCLCAGTRFAFPADAVTDAGYCHCSICRRSTGAPVLVWAVVPTDRVTLEGAPLRRYRSSETGSRYFCGTCGAQVYFQMFDHEMSFNIGTLDDASAIVPTVHVCEADRLAWLTIDDDLPRYDGTDAPAPGERPKAGARRRDA